MPKRRNPFGDCSPLQLKQHVGTREIDLGVNQHEKMRSVYERTRDLLFSGSKRSFDVPKDANCNEIYPDQEPMEQTMCNGQMQISNVGHLTNPALDCGQPNAFQALMMARKGSTVSSCQCCKGQAASQNRCGFCEKSICYDCVRSCSSCDGHFCPLCSVMNYDEVCERSFCLQCAS
ncbi:Apoptosis regulatory protein Siva [Mactra antiquata]